MRPMVARGLAGLAALLLVTQPLSAQEWGLYGAGTQLWDEGNRVFAGGGISFGLLATRRGTRMGIRLGLSGYSKKLPPVFECTPFSCQQSSDRTWLFDKQISAVVQPFRTNHSRWDLSAGFAFGDGDQADTRALAVGVGFNRRWRTHTWVHAGYEQRFMPRYVNTDPITASSERAERVRHAIRVGVLLDTPRDR